MLGALQRTVLEAFFRRESRFFLTGGAALAGYHLGHRTTEDLDLFTTEDAALDAGEAALRAVAGELGATIEGVVTAPDFRRRLIRLAEEGVIVDLVRDRAPQVYGEKPRVGDVRVDPPGEILANKLCALLSRCEPRDLVDVLFLERAGLSIEGGIVLGNRKDGGLTPAQLAWLLSQIRVGDDARIPAGVSPAELRAFLASVQARLTRLAFPGGSDG